MNYFYTAELSLCGRVLKLVWTVTRIILAFGFLYLFICSLDILSSAFQLLAGKMHSTYMCIEHFTLLVLFSV